MTERCSVFLKAAYMRGLKCLKTFMKTTQFLSVLLLSISIFNTVLAQDKELPTTLTKSESGYSFEKIADLPSVTKEQAYDRVKQWILTNFKTADNNIAFDDKEKGSISTSTTIMLDKSNWMITVPSAEFKISFFFKEGKIKITASQFVMQSNNYLVPFDQFPVKKSTRHTYESFDEKFTAMINTIIAAANKKGDNW